MRVYIVIYDISGGVPSDYHAMDACIEQNYESSEYVATTSWIIATTDTARDVRTTISKTKLEGKLALFVGRLRVPANFHASYNLDPDVVNWINTIMKQPEVQ